MQKVNAHILIIDDDTDVLHTARVVLKSQFSKITTESNPQQINYLLNHNEYDVIVLDMNYTAGVTSGKEGLFWLKEIIAKNPSQQIIMITAYGDIKLAVEAMKIGAADFVVKPWENERLQATVYTAYQHSQAKKELSDLKNKNRDLSKLLKGGHQELIGKSAPMQQVFKMINKVAATEANILILGENGTGKELIAQAIHQNSERNDQPFIKVDLGAIPDSLFESELFGHKKGAFTDAKEDRSGRFAVANGGTLFLDEVGNVPLPMQAKLLTAIQSKTVIPVGSNKPIPVDCRIISATNSNLSQMAAEKDFREDLLYRLNTIEIHIPPLRNRKEDIGPLTEFFLNQYSVKYRKSGLTIKAETLDYLSSYDWPGNIRELQHAVERAVIMTDNDKLQPDDFILSSSGRTVKEKESLNLDDIEKETIEQALNKFNGNVSKAAKELGLGRTTMYRKMEKYGIPH